MEGKELSIEKELELARKMAISGPDDAFNEDSMNRSLKIAKRKSEEEGRDISKEIKEINEIWESNCKICNLIDELNRLGKKRKIDVEEINQKIQEKFFGWKFG